MTAQNYKINFPYKAQDGVYYGPNGSVGLYHRGNDRPTPTGTPIVIEGKTIGLTGATGIVSGPHLHTQGARPGGYIDFKPDSYEFRPGVVMEAGRHPQFGNYIRIRVTSQADIIYAHLSKIYVKKGDTIKKGEEMPSKADIEDMFGLLDKKPTAKQIKGYQEEGWESLAKDVGNALRDKWKAALKAGPESNDQALKDSLYAKIKAVFNK